MSWRLLAASEIGGDPAGGAYETYETPLRLAVGLSEFWASRGGSAYETYETPRGCRSRQDRRDDLAVDVGQPHVTTAEAVCQPLVVHAQ